MIIPEPENKYNSNQQCNNLELSIKQSANDNIGFKYSRENKSHTDYWWTDDCTEAVKAKRKAYRNYIKNINSVEY